MRQFLTPPERYIEKRIEAEKKAFPWILATLVVCTWGSFIDGWIGGNFLPTIILKAFAEEPVFGILTALEAKVMAVTIGLFYFLGMIVVPVVLGRYLYLGWRYRQ